MTICGRLLVLVVMTGMGASSLTAQKVAAGTGLEVDDPSRLGVHLIPGHGLEHGALKAIVEREFALAGVQMTDLDDPREGKVLYVWLGEARLESDETRSRIRNLRLEFWRPVGYELKGATVTVPAMTWVGKGDGTAGWVPGSSLEALVCHSVAIGVRGFLEAFLQANGKPYAPPDDPAVECP